LRGEVSKTRQCATEAIEIAEMHHFPYLQARGLVALGWCCLQEGDIAQGIDHLKAGIAAFHATGALTTLPAAQALLAGVLGAAGRAEDGLGVIAEALDYIETSGERDMERNCTA
jgi:predicted ATPase